MASQFPSIRFVFSRIKRTFSYPLEPDITCDSIIRRFARDSGIEISALYAVVPTCDEWHPSSDPDSVYIEAHLLKVVIKRLIAHAHRQTGRYFVCNSNSAMDVPLPAVERFFGQSAGQAIMDELASDARTLRRGRLAGFRGVNADDQFEEPPVEIDPNVLYRRLNFETREKPIAMEISIEGCSLFHKKPVYHFFVDNTSVGDCFILPPYFLPRKPEDRLRDLGKRLEEKLGSDLFLIQLKDEDVTFYGMMENDDEVADYFGYSIGWINVTRIGTGRISVRFNQRTTVELDISFHWTLERLVDEIRQCSPSLKDVDFYLCVSGQILSSDEQSRKLGAMIDDSHVIDVVFNMPDSSDASKEESRMIERISDMNVFLQLQTEQFLDESANKLASMSLDDYISEVSEMIMKLPSVTSNEIANSVPSALPENENQPAGQVTISVEVPANAVRFMRLIVYDSKTKTEHLIEKVTVCTRVYTVLERLQKLLKRSMCDYTLCYNDRFIIDHDRTLGELNILHGCRLVLENENDFVSADEMSENEMKS